MLFPPRPVAFLEFVTPKSYLTIETNKVLIGGSKGAGVRRERARRAI